MPCRDGARERTGRDSTSVDGWAFTNVGIFYHRSIALTVRFVARPWRLSRQWEAISSALHESKLGNVCISQQFCFFQLWNFNYPYKRKIMGQIYWIWGGTWWRSWLRHCATRRKVTGSIPMVSLGFFIDKILPVAPWISLYEYQEVHVRKTTKLPNNAFFRTYPRR